MRTGLAAAARAGLIHRDVKPSNLVRLADGRVKVTDFGLAKPVDPGSEPALTAMGVVVGTPDYIAPEQARGEAIDERVDIYALGGTLYFVLTGMPPFRTGKPAEDKYLKVVARHLRNPPPDAAVTNPNVDRELAELSRLMMSKKPGERPSYDELIARLTQVLARIDPNAVPVLIASRERSRPITLPPGLQHPGGARPSTLDDQGTYADDDLDRLPPRAFPGWLVALTFVCIALFVAGLVVYLRRAEPPSGSTTGDNAAPADAQVASADGPAVPTGMLLVRKKDGSQFYADAKPVTLATFQAVFKSHPQKGKPEDPVVDVSYNEAFSFATTKKSRLLTSEEWDAASVTPGFVAVDKVFEWVSSDDSPGDKDKTVRLHNRSETRPDARHKDVTFRMARNAP